VTINLARATLATRPLNLTINARVEEASVIAHALDIPRNYLGASLIGDDCARKIQFEWMAAAAAIPARVRSIFARGHFFEAESRTQLVSAGFIFAPLEALGFVTADGLIKGHADGIIIAVPAGLDLITPAIWECKGLNAKNFRVPRYATQVSLYQQFLEVTNPALITLVNSDTCERLHFALPFDPRLAQAGSDRAMMIIGATQKGELLARLDPTLQYFRCGYCSFRERCERYE
jgi:hypothetical protein